MRTVTVGTINPLPGPWASQFVLTGTLADLSSGSITITVNDATNVTIPISNVAHITEDVVK